MHEMGHAFELQVRDCCASWAKQFPPNLAGVAIERERVEVPVPQSREHELHTVHAP
jgi:hypothetical protein